MITQPTLTITRRAADRLRAGHLWVYRTDLASEAEAQALQFSAGQPSLVTVVDQRRIPLGTALYSSASQIAARVVSRTPALTREQYLSDVRERIHAAVARRAVLAPVSEENNALRLIFSEADDLPGIVADRYNDLVLLQLLTQGTAQDDVRAAVVDALRTALVSDQQPLTIWERPDPRIRQLEQLEAPADGPLFSTQREAPTQTRFALNGLSFAYDAASGQKTGAFLDQRLNYAAAARWVKESGRTGRALDICTYQGGFALHLAKVCEHVTGVDASRAALEIAEQNRTLNPDLRAYETTDWVEADAFEYLRHLDDLHAPQKAGAPFVTTASSSARVENDDSYDAIVLDPPAFAKSKRAAEGALRGYKELNLRAMRLLHAGGTLITCSCSHHVSLEEFTGVVAAAAADAGRRVQLLETRAAAPDHPEVITLPETRYLKCLILRVE